MFGDNALKKDIRILILSLFAVMIILSSCATEKVATEQTRGDASPIILNGDIVEDNGPTITDLNIKDLEIINTWGHGNIFGIDISPNGKTLAISTTTGIYLHDAVSLAETGFIDVPISKSNNEKSPYGSISFSRDGNFIAIGSDDTYIWNITQNKLFRRINNQIDDYDIVRVLFLPDGNSVAVVSLGLYKACDAAGGNLAVYDIHSNIMVYNHYFCSHPSPYYIDVSDDGIISFFTSSLDNLGGFFNFTSIDYLTGNNTRQVIEDIGYVTSMTADGILISGYQDGYTTFFDPEINNITYRLKGFYEYLSNEFLIRKADEQWESYTYDGSKLCTFEDGYDFTLLGSHYNYQIHENYLFYWDVRDRGIYVWDLETCDLISSKFFPSPNNNLVYSSCGKYIFSNDGRYIQVYKGETGELLVSFPGVFNTSPSQYFDISEEGGIIVYVSRVEQYSINISKIGSDSISTSFTTGFDYPNYISISPNSELAITIDYDGAHLWDLEDGSLLLTLSELNNYVNFSPDSELFVATNEGNIEFRDTESGQLLDVFPFPDNSRGFTFSDKWELIAISQDTHISIWNTQGKIIMELDRYPMPISRIYFRNMNDSEYSSIFMDMDFNPDNNLFAATRYDYDKTYLDIWNLNTGELVREIRIPFRCNELAFNPTGDVLSVLGDGVIINFGINEKH